MLSWKQKVPGLSCRKLIMSISELPISQLLHLGQSYKRCFTTWTSRFIRKELILTFAHELTRNSNNDEYVSVGKLVCVRSGVHDGKMYIEKINLQYVVKHSTE